MNYNKEDFKTWDEAARWLQKHGYGLELIRIEKEKWEESNTVKASAKPEVKQSKPETKPAVETTKPAATTVKK